MDVALLEHPEVSVRSLCRMLGVDRSWYCQKPEQHSSSADVELGDAIERIVLEFPGYGYRRVTEELHRQEWDVNHTDELGCQAGVGVKELAA